MSAFRIAENDTLKNRFQASMQQTNLGDRDPASPGEIRGRYRNRTRPAPERCRLSSLSSIQRTLYRQISNI